MTMWKPQVTELQAIWIWVLSFFLYIRVFKETYNIPLEKSLEIYLTLHCENLKLEWILIKFTDVEQMK